MRPTSRLWLTPATPNHKEACSSVSTPEFYLKEDRATFEKLDRLGAQVQRKWNCDYLMITLGAHGMCLLSRSHPPRHLPTKAKEVFDVTGAGDTVIAAAMLGLLAGASYYEFASLANHAAGVVVGKLGTATCSPEELLESMGQRRETG
ncbi:MAG: PfkB family carbohydrate kinase [Verrucomicrobiota bacterium]|nr:PfkB family carbohydrate kinase [Verrucomicrobiota bacterium]